MRKRMYFFILVKFFESLSIGHESKNRNNPPHKSNNTEPLENGAAGNEPACRFLEVG